MPDWLAPVSGTSYWSDGRASNARPRVPVQRPPAPSEVDFRRVGPVLQRRGRLMLLGLVFVLGAVALLTYFWEKTYESTATFLVDKENPRAEPPALAALERLGRGSQIQTEMKLMQSRNVVEPVVADLDLHVVAVEGGDEMHPSEVFPEFDARPDASPGVYRLLPSAHQGYRITDAENDSVLAVASTGARVQFAGLTVRLPDRVPPDGLTIRTTLFPRVVAGVQGRIKVSLVHRDADLMELSCKGSTPIAAQQLCERISNSYLRLRTDLQRAEATATATFLRDQVVRLGARLATAEDSLEAYARRKQIVALGQQAAEEVQQFAQVQAQRDQLEAERAALAASMDAVSIDQRGSRKYRDLASFPTFLRSPAVTALVESLVELENRRGDLAVRRTEQNVDLAAVDARVGEIERQLQAIATRYEQGLALQIKSLDRTLGQASRRLMVIPGEQVRSARLERQVSVLEEVYRLLETRLREAEVAEAVKLPDVRIVDAASRPVGPSSPNLFVNLGLGLVMGVGFGVALGLSQEYRDTRLHEREDVQRETGLPILTMIPRLRRPGPVVRVLPVPTVTVEGSRRHRRAPGPREENEVALDAFRGLAADLRFVDQQLNYGGLRSVALTSAGRGEGKTLSACNLALVRASHGARTLLIDADMRASGVATFFKLRSPEPGLSEVLSGSAEVEEVWRELPLAGHHTLWVIPAGARTSHSTELLESPSFEVTLHRARRQFDLVLVDTPPLNLIPDAAIIAALVGGVVLVVRGGVTAREGLEIAMERLARANPRVLGVVLNGVKLPEGYVSRYHNTPTSNEHVLA